MIRHRLLLIALALLCAVPSRLRATPAAGDPRVLIHTSVGDIIVAVDVRHAPITAANFLAYVDRKRFDGTGFYRAARSRGAPDRGLIQGGIRHLYTRLLAPIAHEPTSRTGLRHVDGTISMARHGPGTAMGDFFIISGAIPAMDAHGSDPGYAAFGHVVSGMPVVRRILRGYTVPNVGDGAMVGQLLARPITIISARRLP